MSRRGSFSGSQSPPQFGRSGADVVYSRRAEEEPRRIYLEISNVGKQIADSKKRCRWRFSFGDLGDEHDIVLIHSKASSKKKIILDNDLIHESQKFAAGAWSHAWTMGPHLLRIEINGPELEYDLVVDGIPYHHMKLRDASLAPPGGGSIKGVLAASLKTLREDEERREAIALANKAELAEAVAASKKKESLGHGKLTKKGSSRSVGSSGNGAPDILSADPRSLQAPQAGQQGFDPFANGGGGDGGAYGGGFDPLAQGQGGYGYDPNMSQLNGHFQGLSVQQQGYGDGSGAYYDPSQQQLAQQQGGYWAGQGQPGPEASTYGGFDPSQWTHQASTEQQQQWQQQQQAAVATAGGEGIEGEQSHQRIRSLDKDLWVVGQEKRLVALDDLTDSRRVAEKIQPASWDRRSLAELAVHQPMPDNSRGPAMRPPPAPPQPQYALVPVGALVPYGAGPVAGGYGSQQQPQQLPPPQQQYATGYAQAQHPQQFQTGYGQGPPGNSGPYYVSQAAGYGNGY